VAYSCEGRHARYADLGGGALSYRAALQYDHYVYDADVFVRGRILSIIDYL
jgi:hypothetical protein